MHEHALPVLREEPEPAYTLTRSRRRTIAIHVKHDGSVEVRAPLRLANSEIERFVASKSSWVKLKQAQFEAMRSKTPHELPPLYPPGEFERIARELVRTWEQRLGVTVTYVGFRTMSSCWGSCTSKTGRIRLNTALARLPLDCLEYLIVHELAHLLENSHSPRFWAIVADALPGYEECRKKMKSVSWLPEKLKEA